MAGVTWKEYAGELEAAVGAILAELRESDATILRCIDALRTRVELLERDVWAGQEGGADDQG